MKLSDYIINESDNLTATVEYKEGIRFIIRYVSRSSLMRLSRDCLTWKYDEKAKGRTQQLDNDRFAESFCRRCVVGWSGVTPHTLSKLIPLDLSKIDAAQRDEPLDFDFANLLVLVKNAYELDSFLQDTAVDIKVFRPDLEHELGNSNTSQSGT
jgi:hypothetical protein